MAPYGTLPLKAPLPTAWSLPFQLAAGSHTSILMSESPDGFSVAATRQNAGGGFAACALGAPSGVNWPAASASASVTVPFGNVSELSSAHARPTDCAAAVWAKL